MLKPCFSKFCYVFLYLGGSGVLSFVQKKIMTAEGKMFGKLFAKMECLRQQLTFGARARNHKEECQISPS